MSMQSTTLAFLFCAGSATAVLASDALTPVPLPADFGVHAIGSVEAVVYTESSGELMNPTNRSAIERVCEALRASGGTTKIPLFETGYDKPIKTETKRYTNARHSASYTVEHRYTCDASASKASGSDGVCGCTYRVVPSYLVQIRNQTAAGLENIHLDINKRTATRRVTPGAARIDADRGEGYVRELAPDVVGKDVVAGIPCVLRRQKMGGKEYMDICVTEDPEKKLPPDMRFRTLSEYMPRSDGKGVSRSSKADKIVLDGTVDAAVFAIPEGFTVKEMK